MIPKLLLQRFRDKPEAATAAPFVVISQRFSR